MTTTNENVTALKSFDELMDHVGHELVCVDYADGAEVSIECSTCGEVLVSIERIN